MTLVDLQDLIPKLQQLHLPGTTAHNHMAPPSRARYVAMAQRHFDEPKQAAVLLLLYPNQFSKICFALIRRNQYPGAHSGQIGFPGGKIEKSDASSWAAALRETQEEIGVVQHQINLVRPLTSLYIPPSNFNVAPYLAWTSEHPKFKLNSKEVAGLIEVPVRDFLRCKPQFYQDQLLQNEAIEDIPYYELQSHRVWGATAMMLSEFQQLMLAFEG